MRSARMLIVDRGDGNKARDDGLRALDALLPSHWHIIGDIPPRPILNAERRGSTEPFDALVIGEKSISVVNIVNEPGHVRVRIDKAYEVDGEEVAWAAGKPSSLRDFNTEVHKLCLLLRDRLDVDPYRVAGKMIWVGATQIDHESSATREEVTDIEQFVELAVKRDERMLLGPLPKQQVEAIAGYFLATQQEEEGAGSSDPDGGESAEDFLISPGEARSGGDAAERALPAPVQAGATAAMVRNASFEEDDAPSGSSLYRFDDWADGPDNFGPAPKAISGRADGSGARTLWLWLGGGGLFAMGAATAAMVMVAQDPRRSEIVAAVPDLDAGRTEAQDFGVIPQVIAPDPSIYGPVEDFALAEVPPFASGAAGPPPAAPQRAGAARAQSAAATTRTEARRRRPARAEAAPAKSERSSAGRILCILPDGGEVQMARASCRAQSGLIYQ